MILDRIKEFIDYKNISISAFEKSLGMSNASFSKSLKSGKGIGTDKLDNILNIYPEISPEWLLTGKGSMLRESKDSAYYRIFKQTLPYTDLNLEELAKFCRIGKERMEDIYHLKVQMRVDELGIIVSRLGLTPSWVDHGCGGQFVRAIHNDNIWEYKDFIRNKYEEFISSLAHPASNTNEGIPLIPISAMAGAFTGEQVVLEYECERFIVPTFKGAEFLISVRGSSMYPKYNSGDIVACKKVPKSGLFFQWNKVYVLDTDQGPLIKRVKPGSDENHVLIISDNPNYEPFELHLNSIYNVALVLGVIRLE